MHKTSGNKWNKRICKWIASFLTVALLVNQSCFSALAEEHEEYEYIGDVAVTTSDEEAENSDVFDRVDVDANTDTDTDADANTNAESGIESNTESDIDIGENEEIIPPYDEYESINEEEIIEFDAEDTASTAVGDIFSDGNLKYKVINDDMDNLQVEVSRYEIWKEDGEYASGTLDIPSTVTNGTDEYKVIGIGDSAFWHSPFTNITIPDSVIKIGKEAFRQSSSLTSMKIPDNVTSIGEYAFTECTGLSNVTIPDSVTSIEGDAFNSCYRLKSITIPDSITSIGIGTFCDCYSLTDITIPDSITEIRWCAFSNCRSLESITIPDNVTSIDGNVFSGCRSLTSIIIPNGITSIGMDTFKSCNSLTSVTLLNDNINIDWNAFTDCTQLKNLQIALSENITVTPTMLWDNCFSQCPDDRSLTFLTEDGKTELSNLTTPTLAEAVKAYNAVDDGGIDDGYWYGWKLPEVGEVPDNEETFTITASAGTGGSVTPSGAIKVKSGDSQQFTILQSRNRYVPL